MYKRQLLGSGVNALLLLALPWWLGLAGIPLAAVAGVLVTALALMRRQALLGQLAWVRYWLCAGLLLGISAGGLFGVADTWLQLGLTTLFAAATLAGMALILRPWRAA